MAELTREQIMRIIPHRDPFLLVDEILDLNMDTMTVRGVKHVREDEYFFRGHFPGNPVMPGVLVLEAIAQNGAVCVLSIPEFKNRIALFARANNVRFKGMILPGDDLVMETKMQKLKAGVAVSSGTAWVNGQVVCTAEITCMIK